MYSSDIQFQKGWVMQRTRISRLLVLLICAGIFQTYPIGDSAHAAVGSQSICFGGSQTRYFEYPTGQKIGDTSFTLEMWVKPKTWTAYMNFLNTGYGSGGSYLGYNTNTGQDKIIFYSGAGGLKGDLGSNGMGTVDQQKVLVGVWSHVAYVREVNSKTYLFINGIKVAEGGANNYDFSWPKLDIGSNFDGCMTSVRLAKSAFYSANFTPAALGSFSVAPGGTDVLVALTADGETISNTGTAGAIKGSGTITYESIKSSSRTIAFAATSYSLNNGDTQTVTANISAGTGAISYSAGVSTACTVDSTSGLVTITSGTGTCSISATSAEDDNYVAATTTVPVTITVNKMLQSAVSITLSPTTKVIKSGFSQALTTLSGSGGAGTGAFSYSVSTVTAGANCALANNAGTYTLSADTAGTCALTATRASDASYQSASASTNFIFSTPVRTLSFATTAYTLAYLATQQVTATTSANGGPTVITYSAGVSTACSVGANTGIVSITASTGTCSISASVAEDVTYLATSTVTPVAITVGKANQAPVTLSISPTSKNSLAPFTQELVTLSATGGSGTGVLAYSIADVTAGATCQLTENAGVYTVTAATAGTCSITATKPADSNYFEASNSKTFSFNANRTLTYAAGLGGGVKIGVTAPTAGPFLTGDTFVIAAGSAYERAGFSFTGWSDGTNTFAAGDNYTVASANITLTAQWRQTSLFGILDADLEEMQSWNASNRTNSGTISNTAGTSSVTVTVPANSLTSGTTVKLWELKNSDFAKSKVDPSKDYIVNLVLSWLKDNGVGQAQTVPTASTPITLSISNNTIKKGAIAYQIIGDVVTQIGTATADGVLNLSITEDPVISIANPIVEAPNNGGGGGGGGAPVVIVEKTPEVVKPIEVEKPVEVVPVLAKTVQVTHKVFFGMNAAWINSANIKSLKSFIAKISASNQLSQITVEGFTQPTPINPNPLVLSKARANSVAKLIRLQGVKAKIVKAGKGDEKVNDPSSRYVLVTVTTTVAG